jgi:predicted nuclease of predicted toxin-antitoxin system
MADLYANENFPLAVVQHLREMGHRVLTSLEAGTANQRISDEQVLAFATREKRAILTHNRRDFKKLHRRKPNHAGIIICTNDADFEALASRIEQGIKQNEPLEQKLISVTR